MNQQKTPMKILTRIRLINWHYFINETIDVNGSVLFSGENASGKSTILDAILLVLTTVSNKFNPAANEKSKRDLKGYVRCKTGEEGNTYVRSKGAVISYVALEFYEESRDKYFVIGVKIDSPDLDSDLIKKWFNVEGKLESLSFIVNGRPALDKEFLQDGKKVQFENRVNTARDNFRTRLGRLDNSFPDMMVRSMAFKPIHRVKDFINQYILQASEIDTATLQESIRNLRELKKLLNEVKAQIQHLKKILGKADEIEDTDEKMLVIDILLSISKLEDLKQNLEEAKKRMQSDKALLVNYELQKERYNNETKEAQKKINDLNVAMETNENMRLIERLEDKLEKLNSDKKSYEKARLLFGEQRLLIEKAAGKIPNLTAKCRTLNSDRLSLDERIVNLEFIKAELYNTRSDLYASNAGIDMSINKLILAITETKEIIEGLKRNRPSYSSNTKALVAAINEEFAARRIDSEARIFSDLLEISMPEWRNAVEGYLNTQRFNIIVDPKYYDIAAEVYDRIKDRVHSVGLVNTGKIVKGSPVVMEGSLAEAVSTENRYARAYADYILGRVIRCDEVSVLKKYSISITKGCMRYQGHVLSKIDPAVYKTPFIGRQAIEIQLKNAEEELKKNTEQKTSLEREREANKNLIASIDACNFEIAGSTIVEAEKLSGVNKQIAETEKDLSDAKGDPTFIELGIKRERAEKELDEAKKKYDQAVEKIINKERDIADGNNRLVGLTKEIGDAVNFKETITAGNLKAAADAEARYNDAIRSKTAGKITENYLPRRKTLENQREKYIKELIELQVKYKDGDFGTGMEVLGLYRDDLQKLEGSDLLSYEEKLAKSQEDCELEFRENFLAKMRENIQKAQISFDKLNRSLKGIYYGNDSYKFELTANKERQALYDMITSDINIEGETLFSSAFEDKYHAEMEELFSKLTDENLSDSTVVNDLTDYRSYLDYDILIIDRDGRMQRFSKTYGEKSGGETQTPYYVAIAASFASMYSGRETIRILMFDEAFNNMDEDRIESMMKFLKEQDFQVILAAPPSRLETIGEYVDSIFLAIHKGQVSTIEEYYL